MPLRQDLLNPIPGDNPSGSDLRYKAELDVYDRIQEARRQDDDLPQGAWEHERKVADYSTVIKLSQETLATQSKDLQLAAWLTEALLRKEGFAGLNEGLQLCYDLLTAFWETVYPIIADGDTELRAKPLNWMGTSLEVPVMNVPLVKAGYDFLKFKESRLVGYEDQAQSDNEKKKRTALLKEGKLPPEVFDKAFAETPKSFYANSEKDLDSCLGALKKLERLCDEKFGDAAPSFGRMKTALEEVRHTVHSLLDKKRELEPDPVEPVREAPDAGAPEAQASAAPTSSARLPTGSIVIPLASTERAERREAIAAVAQAAAMLRKQEPQSPAPYLMMRGLRWGELRASAGALDPNLLEAPTTELRQHVKRLALTGNWKELLETAENAMSLPCSRAWLDLQHLVVLACRGLGDDYERIATAIASELIALIRDLPSLLTATLLDGTPTANPETRAWLAGLAPEPQPVMVRADVAAAPSNSCNGAEAAVAQAALASWWEKSTDPYTLSQEAVKAGNLDKAIAIMHQEIARQQSGRARFQRTLQFVRLCVAAGSDAIVQPLIEDLAGAIELHKLDDWEDHQMVADALVLVMTASKRLQGDSAERRKLFERVCRLDPVRALHTG